MLTVTDHRRDYSGFRYVYPVVSRRAGGVSVGINLNPNNACNWACVYCQVPDLTRGGPPPIDLALLEQELAALLQDITAGDFMAREVPEGARRLMDVAFSGNGEPTSAAEFAEAVARVAGLMDRLRLPDAVSLRLITNGSLLHRAGVRDGIRRIGEYRGTAGAGEVWFKIDRATREGIAAVNKIDYAPDKARGNLIACAELAPTWVQTCWFALDGAPPDEREQSAYLDLLAGVRDKIKGVHLYSLARPSLQPDAGRLGRLAADQLAAFAARISALGIEVVLNP
ncbi:radical SAM protein [Azospira restricta]|uniref:Radical SAM protein n=1 Tax=Azospira restricta TaxID=404405 RepID=A0A974SN00_9RHOO|nr:radical SAM protein [Azospira restricta]QRJ62183.1 radical SAM protein [Azospira restricta]